MAPPRMDDSEPYGVDRVPGADRPSSHNSALAITTGPIAEARNEIDAIDHEITDLVRRRMEISQGIQSLRLAHGGVRIEPGRELVIVNHYASRLGEPGAEFAGLILRICRGS